MGINDLFAFSCSGERKKEHAKAAAAAAYPLCIPSGRGAAGRKSWAVVVYPRTKPVLICLWDSAAEATMTNNDLPKNMPGIEGRANEARSLA